MTATLFFTVYGILQCTVESGLSENVYHNDRNEHKRDTRFMDTLNFIL
jgi:hypothetical protein